MEEELSENELHDRLYSMVHYADDTQENLNVNQKDVLQFIENRPKSTVRRYWHTNVTNEDNQTAHHKVNTPKEPSANKNIINDKPRAEKRHNDPSPPNNLLSMFQSPVSQNLKKTIEIIENDDDGDCQVVALESSDEDEVIEVALPPKPTITIESSDEDEVRAITETKNAPSPDKKPPSSEREVSASPAPSVVSSVSDEFIRGDCIALNISSRHPNIQTFDFSLHGSDLLVQTPSKKRKRKKNKDANTSAPIASTPNSDLSTVNNKEECFATPKSKAKNKRPKTKSYVVSEKSLPNPDVYDSDSNQSVCDLNKTANIDSDKNITRSDDHVSDSSQSTIEIGTIELEQVKACVSVETEKHVSKEVVNPPTPKQNDSSVIDTSSIVDLTGISELNNSFFSIDENIVMGNVSGFSELDEYEDMTLPIGDAPKLGSTNVPEILYADLDFNNLNGKNRPYKKRRYSLSTLRAEMEKFYNESWGGENFNHREIQKYMSRDKSLWVIDPKDRISVIAKRKVTCNYCNRQGHRDDMCRLKPPVCYMCGCMGHREPRCPRKICVNCGSPNHMYSSMCRNCCNWRGIMCAECGQTGHPASHCPDLWRRYHNTISEDTPLEENHQTKKHHQTYCSGCTRRGHLVHACRVSIPFSGLPINSPYVTFYNPIYFPSQNPQNPNQAQSRSRQQDDTISSGQDRTDRHKRQSKSPVVHETHLNKKRNVSGTESADPRANTKSPVNGQKRKTSQSKDPNEAVEGTNKDDSRSDPKTANAEKALDFIPIGSGNHDKSGQVIQDNEVSDTSDVVTSARIYVTGEVMEKLNTAENQAWLNETMGKNNVTIQKGDVHSFLNIKGTVGDQEAFQVELRDWIKENIPELPKPNNNSDVNSENEQSLSNNIPKKRNDVLRVINKALDSLKDNLGDPNALFKELNYLQNRHQQLLKQKEISPKQLSNNRTNMNSISRKLNMVLLGQAGLADGTKHLNELCSLHEKITHFRQKIIPPQMRQEIGQHFHCIFTANPRKDYADLLTKYYVSRNKQAFSKTKKNDKFTLNPKPKQSKNMNQMFQNHFNIQRDQMENKMTMIETDKYGNVGYINKCRVRLPPVIQKTRNKLVFFHRRLLHSAPVDSVLKKTRVTLISQLHAQIASLGNNMDVSPKTLKKMRKIQEQAQLFLNNV